jgi:hypothetical protein
MPRLYIDLISSYCDSWCERCALTERCSHVPALAGMLATQQIAMHREFPRAMEFRRPRFDDPQGDAAQNLRQ